MKLQMYFIALFVVVLCSCSTEPENDYITFKIEVDKLTYPDTVSVNDSLTILFDGMVGSDGCHGFSHFEVINNANVLEITVWGTKPNYNAACPAVMVYLNKKEFKTLLKQKGIYRIIIHQPDNSLLISSVFVR